MRLSAFNNSTKTSTTVTGAKITQELNENGLTMQLQTALAKEEFLIVEASKDFKLMESSNTLSFGDFPVAIGSTNTTDERTLTLSTKVVTRSEKFVVLESKQTGLTLAGAVNPFLYKYIVVGKSMIRGQKNRPRDAASRVRDGKL